MMVFNDRVSEISSYRINTNSPEFHIKSNILCSMHSHSAEFISQWPSYTYNTYNYNYYYYYYYYIYIMNREISNNNKQKRKKKENYFHHFKQKLKQNNKKNTKFTWDF